MAETLQSFDKFKHLDMESSFTKQDYLAGTGGVTQIGQSLEKDTSLALSGIPISNSRSLTLELEFDDPGEATVLTTFLDYTSVSRCFLNNCSNKI